MKKWDIQDEIEELVADILQQPGMLYGRMALERAKDAADTIKAKVQSAIPVLACETCKMKIESTESYVCIRRTCQEYADPDFKTVAGRAETFEHFFHYDCHEKKTVNP